MKAKQFSMRDLLMRASFICFASVTVADQAAAQSDTTSYSYDARGRLVSVSQATPVATASTSYNLDAADNRQRVAVTVSGGGGGGQCTVTAQSASPVAGHVDTPYWVPVTLSSGCSGTVVVNYATRDGTAVANQDYPPLSGALSFSQAETQYVRVRGNAYSAGKEYFLDLTTSYSNVTIANPSVYVSIDYP